MIKIRQETSADYPAVFTITKDAFSTLAVSDHTEHFLVERLRKSAAFIPELSLVAEQDGEIVGHILLTKIQIKNDQASFESLTLAPVSVKPGFQRKGIGSQLIKRAHTIAQQLGFQSVILLGHANYYPRFGYERCSKHGISLPFEANDESAMVKELVENGLTGVEGTVVYAKEFFE